MSHRKFSSIILIILIHACLVGKLLADFQHDLDISEVQNFMKIVQQKNLLTSPLKREIKRKFSNPCFGEIYEFVISILKKEPWTLKMVDAASKIPSGLLVGNTVDLGMYDECLAIRENKNGSEIRGRHCIYSLGLSSELQNLNPKLSVCVPSKCNSTDVTHLLNLLIFNMTNISSIGIQSVEASCSKIYAIDWTTGSSIALLVTVIIVLFLLCCTFLDLLKMKTNLQNNAVNTCSRFSLQRSALKILKTKINPASFPVLNGIRFLSICWVVMGHAYTQRGFKSVNKIDGHEWINSWISLYVTLALFAVDSFFTLSGFLMAYIFLKEISKGGKFNLFGYYLHRYLRLTPAMGMLVMIAIFFAPYLGSGPVWDDFVKRKKCKENWWIILLYLQNFIKHDAWCLGHLWYLAVDMQLFWFSPIILYPLSKKPKIGLAILAVAFLASTAAIATITVVNKYSSNTLGPAKNIGYFRNVYTMPYTRAGPWLVGIFFGYLTVSEPIKLNKMTATLGWICAFASFAFCTLGASYIKRKNYEYDLVWETIYGSTGRSIWAFGLSWIIFASIQGYAGFVAKFLSLPIFFPLAKLSYCVYLIHQFLQEILTHSVRIYGYFSNYEMFTNFLSDLVLSVAIAFFFSLFFESPMLILEKMIFRSKKKEKQMKKSEEEMKKNEFLGQDLNGQEKA